MHLLNLHGGRRRAEVSGDDPNAFLAVEPVIVKIHMADNSAYALALSAPTGEGEAPAIKTHGLRQFLPAQIFLDLRLFPPGSGSLSL